MIRKILIPESQIIQFNIPEYYIGKQVELIIFEKEEGIIKQDNFKKQVSFNAVSIDTLNLKFNRDEANER